MQLDEWRFIDPETGLVFPYYTKSFLDVLATWDLKDKVVFEYGCGTGSLWWHKKCNYYGIESNVEWFDKLKEIESSLQIGYCNPAWTELYPLYINETDLYFDIIIIDGIERDKCVTPAMLRLKSGGILIIDNWDQPSVDETIRVHRDMLLSKEHYIYNQEGHPDWKTAYFVI